MKKTARQYENIETGYIYSLYQDQTDNFHLIIDEDQGPEAPAIGTECNGFYICAFTDTYIKINNTKVIKLPWGTFYNIKEGEEITHKKFFIEKKFRKAA